MGRTFRRNDRWKKDRRDRNFRKSKKFKDLKSPALGKPHQIQVPDESYDNDINDTI